MTTRLTLAPAGAVEFEGARLRALISAEMPGVVGFSRDELIAAVCDEVLGFGPIEPYVYNPIEGAMHLGLAL